MSERKPEYRLYFRCGLFVIVKVTFICDAEIESFYDEYSSFEVALDVLYNLNYNGPFGVRIL
jgi:hypothetical protein